MRPLHFTIIALLLPTFVACPDTGEDNDFDGYNELVDCNDDDASVYPGHEELCDGQDNDCDGEIDEDIPPDEGTPGFFDGDGDGFGDTALEQVFCGDFDEGFVPVGGDCDDDDPAVNPDAIEDCTDGIDNDCDGQIDEDEDEDGDGFTNCDGDCDDTDPDLNPGAAELCDGIDNDCDGQIDEDFEDLDDDGFAGCAGDCDDTDPTAFPGNPEICDDVDNNCDDLTDNGIDNDGDGFPHDCGEGGLVDVLVVVDNSCSMIDEQDALLANGPSLFTSAIGVNADLNVAVINTTDPAFIARIDASTPDAAGVFGAAVVQGNDGNNIEQPFLRAVEAIELQPDWRRTGAGLSLLILSDEDDQSPVLLASFLGALGDLVTDIAFLRINHISGLATGCNGASGNAIPAPRLVFAGDATGGDSQSICDLDWDLASLIPDVLPSDCDDDDPNVFSGATELCDGIDNDCDGEIDDDSDLDGVTVCDDDCDDTDPSVFPGAPELCDGIDNDCDGSEEGEHDDDLDGALGCEDCAETDPSIFPGATEICGDGTDQDCDGADDDPDGIDSDGDLLDICQGDCDDNDPDIFPLAPENKVDGIDNDCDGLIDGIDTDDVSIHSALTGLANNHFMFGALAEAFDFCGASMIDSGNSSDGYVILSSVELELGDAVFDQTPDATEMGTYSPLLTPLWIDLDGSSGGQFAFSDRLDGSRTLSWLNIPTDADPSDLVNFDATLNADGSFVLRVRDGTDQPGSIIGWSCGGTTPSALDSLPMDGDCIDTSGSDGQFEQFAGPSATGIWSFCPTGG